MKRSFSIAIVIVSVTAICVPLAVLRLGKSALIDELFIGSAMTGDVTTVRLLLAGGVDPNKKFTMRNFSPTSEWDGTALLAAAWQGQRNVVEELLRNGAKVEVRGRGYAAGTIHENFNIGSMPHKGWLYGGCGNAHMDAVAEAGAAFDAGITPLMAATYKGQTAIVDTLLAHGAVVDARSHSGVTALMLAAMRGDIGIVRMLLSAGADVNARSKNNETALILAAWNQEFDDDKQPAWYDQPKLVQILLDAGADISMTTRDGNGPLHGATSYDNAVTALLELLIKSGAPVNGRNNNGQTPLMYAARNLSKENLGTLLANGSNVQERDNDGKTALMYGSESYSESSVRVLLNAGASIDATDNKGLTPLMYAAKEFRNDNIVRLLLKSGAAVNATDRKGQTPVFYGLRSAEITRSLIKAGAVVNVRDSCGSTPLIEASKCYYDTDIVKMLLRRGANVNTTNNDGVSAIRYAAIDTPHWQLDDPEFIFHHLKKAGAVIDPETKLIIASRTERLDIINSMIEKGANVNLRGPDGATILIYAAQEGKVKAVGMLLDLGADPNARDLEGSTALMRAAWNDCSQVTELLLDRGADLEAQSNDGDTAIMRAAAKGHMATVKILLARGARLDVQNKRGDTAITLSRFGSYDVEKLLRNAVEKR
jgi:ankyrin repeat protein